MSRPGAAVAALLLLTACSRADPPREPAAAVAAGPAAAAPPVARSTPAPAAAPLLNLAGEGLAFVDADNGSSRTLPFGVDQALVEHAVAAALGPALREGSNPDCGAGPLDFAEFPRGLTLWFQDHRFVGWAAGGGAANLQTAAGVGVGSTRAELNDPYAPKLVDSTVGVEFDAGGMSGLLASAAPDARITALWAGVSCLFR